MAQESDLYTVDWSEKVAGLVEMAREDRPWYDAMAAALLRPGDRVVVDVGCGAGGMTLALAAALGGPGTVVAVDAEPELLAAVRDQVATRSGEALARVDLVAADLGEGTGPPASRAERGERSSGPSGGLEPVRAALPGPADLIWASASVHHVGDQQAAVDGLAGLLAAGGRLALAEGGLPARHLPWDLGVGEPGLELRLDAANDRWFARMRTELPDPVPMPYGWNEALRRAGLVEITARTTLREQPAPLGEDDRRQLVERFARWVDRLRPTGLLDAADLAAWDRLLDVDDPAWLGHRTDLFRLTARSVHLGTRPG